MASEQLLAPQLITMETLVMLENNLVAGARVNRQFENQFVKIGNSITVRKPNRFKVRTGPAISLQDIQEPSVSITVNLQRGVDWQFTSQELTLTVEEFSERYAKPAAAEIANQVDYDVIGNFNQFFNLLGAPGTTPQTFLALASVAQRMDEAGVPQDGRTLLLNPAAYWTMADALKALFVQSVSEPALKGFLARIANFDIFESQNIQSQTVGAYAGAGVVNGAAQTGSNLVTNGWTGGVVGLLKQGDVITVAGVNAVNPKNRQSTGSLQNFVVTANVSSDGGGNATIPVYPPITTTGAYQTVTGSPANGAAITVKGVASNTYPQNIAFVRDAIGLVCVPMEVPGGVDFAARTMYKNISMRLIRAYDITNDIFATRLDVLYGTTAFYPELGARLTG